MSIPVRSAQGLLERGWSLDGIWIERVRFTHRDRPDGQVRHHSRIKAMSPAGSMFWEVAGAATFVSLDESEAFCTRTIALRILRELGHGGRRPSEVVDVRVTSPAERAAQATCSAPTLEQVSSFPPLELGHVVDGWDA